MNEQIHLSSTSHWQTNSVSYTSFDLSVFRTNDAIQNINILFGYLVCFFADYLCKLAHYLLLIRETS
jgi:hypothetical protein